MIKVIYRVEYYKNNSIIATYEFEDFELANSYVESAAKDYQERNMEAQIKIVKIEETIIKNVITRSTSS